LGGVLNLFVLDGFNPSLGQTFSLFEGAIGSITGAFSAVNAPTFNGHTLNVLYGVDQVTLGQRAVSSPPTLRKRRSRRRRSGAMAGNFGVGTQARRCQWKRGRRRR
jgi:uncharacterized membrane protein HdeD (DUF308 family)